MAFIMLSKKFLFSLGLWAFSFLLGVYSTCSCQIGHEMPSRSFAVLETVCYPDLYFDDDTHRSDPILERCFAAAHDVSSR